MQAITLIKNNLALFFILIGTSVFSQSQSTHNAPYVGTWEYQNGNQIFRITIWEDPIPNPYDGLYYLKGDYKMVEKDNSTETTLYTSSAQNSDALNGTVNDGFYTGIFNEMHDGSSLLGNFEIISSSASEISFSVSKMSGININPEGTTTETDFEVPNNIMLIKKQ